VVAGLSSCFAAFCCCCCLSPLLVKVSMTFIPTRRKQSHRTQRFDLCLNQRGTRFLISFDMTWQSNGRDAMKQLWDGTNSTCSATSLMGPSATAVRSQQPLRGNSRPTTMASWQRSIATPKSDLWITLMPGAKLHISSRHMTSLVMPNGNYIPVIHWSKKWNMPSRQKLRTR
jgi:hypothetical protein